MKSVLLALLLIVNLLMCPLRCVACELTATVGQVPAVTHCCCSHCEDAPVSESPEPCDGECDCDDCICEGAVLEADVELSVPTAYFDAAQPADLVLATIDRQVTLVARDRASTAGPLLSGRDLRVSHQSWLL